MFRQVARNEGQALALAVGTIFMSHKKVIQIIEKDILWTFGGILMIMKCSFKIDLASASKRASTNKAPGHYSGSRVQSFCVLTTFDMSCKNIFWCSVPTTSKELALVLVLELVIATRCKGKTAKCLCSHYPWLCHAKPRLLGSVSSPPQKS